MTDAPPATGPFKRVLVATDFSPHAEAALQSALWLVQKSHGEIEIAHVIPEVPTIVAALAEDAYLTEDVVKADRELRREADARLARLGQQLDGAGVPGERTTLSGTPFVAIIHEVQSKRHDLVICGSRGHSSVRGMLLGSTARRLVRKCPSDVWITHGDVPAAPTAIVAAVDFSELSGNALRRAHWISRKASAPLHVVHVLEPRTLDASVLEAVLKHAGSNWRDRVRDAAERRVHAFVKETLGESAETSIHVDFGEAWELIRDTARNVHADLIVMGTVGRSGIQGVWLGNTAEKLLSVLECAVLTVKPAGFVSPLPPAA